MLNELSDKDKQYMMSINMWYIKNNTNEYIFGIWTNIGI